MTHKLQQLFDVNTNASGQLLDFDFISDENFLLLVALTNKGEGLKCLTSLCFKQNNLISEYPCLGNIITVHHSNGQHKCELVPLFDVYPEYCEPILISLLPDASAVVLVLSNDAFLLIPIRRLMVSEYILSKRLSFLECKMERPKRYK